MNAKLDMTEASVLDVAPVRVAIVGGGIGGVSFAAFVSSLVKNRTSPIRVDIYEASPTLTEVGAGVGMWLRTWNIFESYGTALTESLSQIAPPGKDLSKTEQLAFAFRVGSSSALNGKDWSEPFFELKSNFGLVTLHRAALQSSLASHINPNVPITIHYSKRLTRYTSSDIDGGSSVTMYFEDGSEASADVLVGADGIRSVVRSALYISIQEQPTPQLFAPLWTGTTVYRSLISLDKLLKLFPSGHPSLASPVVYFGKNKHVLAYPIVTPGAKGSAADVVNLVAFCSRPHLEGSEYDGPWMRQVDSSSLRDEFQGWDEEVTRLLEAVTSVSLWAIHTIPPLPFYSRGNVCIIGDAAHAMAPHQGSGGGQAIEDAHVLAHLLTHPSISLSNLPCALEVYDSIRRPIATEVARRSRLNGLMYELNAAYDEHDSASPKERLSNLARSIADIHDWEWTSEDVEGLDNGDRQIERAMQLFEGQ